MQNVLLLNCLRDRLRSMQFRPGQVKIAELGGGQDTPFEQALSNLAHAYLKDKAPKLMEFEVGFQLLEKNQDNTKAVGVFGFKVGNQWLYVPVFFLNGDLKGHELLYVKNQDIFVPLKENWINYLLGRKPSILGESVNRNLSLVGVMPPSLYQLSRSPHKFASALPIKLASWARDFLPDLARLVTVPVGKDPRYAGMKTFPDFLKEAGEPTIRFLIERIGSTHPAIIRCIDQLYGEGMLNSVVRHIAEQKRAAASKSILKDATYHGCGMGKKKRKKKKKKKASILDGRAWGVEKDAVGVRHEVIDEVTFRANPDVIHDLKADEREKLLRERVVIRDGRDDSQVTHAYDVQTEMKLQNPDTTGIYHVLTAPDTFTRCLVVMNPYSHRQRHDFCTVVRLDGERNWINTHPANVWIKAELDHAQWKKWLDSQPEAASLKINDRDDPWAGPRYILLGPRGDGTVPFYCRERFEGGRDDSIVCEVDFDDWDSGKRPAYLPYHARRLRDPYQEGCSCYAHQSIVLTRLPGVKLRVDHDSGLHVPASFRLIEVRAARKKKALTDDEKKKPWAHEKYESDPPPIRLASLTDIQLAIMANTRPLRIYSDGRDVRVDDNRMDKTSALVHLCRDLGLREKAARAIIERTGLHEYRLAFPEDFERKVLIDALRSAARSDTDSRASKIHAVKKLIRDVARDDRLSRKTEKKAEPGDMIRGAPNAPPFPEPYRGYDPVMGGSIPTMQESEFNVKVPDMSASMTDRSIYQPAVPDQRTMAIAQQAAMSGQREVFDTAMLVAMLKSIRQDTMVDRYTSDIMKGMDRLGRVLFQFYWHGEEFEDRYGEQDMPELEDGLRNAFEAVGDVLLALKKKPVGPFPDDGSDVDLGPVSNQ